MIYSAGVVVDSLVVALDFFEVVLLLVFLVTRDRGGCFGGGGRRLALLGCRRSCGAGILGLVTGVQER